MVAIFYLDIEDIWDWAILDSEGTSYGLVTDVSVVEVTNASNSITTAVPCGPRPDTLVVRIRRVSSTLLSSLPPLYLFVRWADAL